MKTYHDPTTGEANQEAYALVCEHDPMCGLNVYGRADEVARIDWDLARANARITKLEKDLLDARVERDRTAQTQKHLLGTYQGYYKNECELRDQDKELLESYRATIRNLTDEKACISKNYEEAFREMEALARYLARLVAGPGATPEAITLVLHTAREAIKKETK